MSGQFRGGQRAFGNPITQSVVADALIVEIRRGRVDESRHDHTAEIEHKAVRHRHHGHVRGMAASGIEKCDRLVFPCAFAREFHEVLKRCVDVVVVDGTGNNDAIGRFDDFSGFGGIGIAVGGSSIAERKREIFEIQIRVIDILGCEGDGGRFGE